MNLPPSITSIVAQAATLPPPLMKLLVRRSLALLPPEAKMELWGQVKDLNVDALDALSPEQWPDTVPPEMQKGVLLMIRVAQESLGKEMTR